MTTSFSDLLSSDDSDNHRGSLSDRITDNRTSSSVPKFKLISPPALRLSPPHVSPSSYFAIPPGLSPTELLDSPVLLNSSSILPSSTTGSFPYLPANWKTYSGNNHQNVKQEDNHYSDFSFQPPARLPETSTTMFQSKNTIQTAQQQGRGFHEAEYSTWKNMIAQQYQSVREQRRSEETILY
ncbi:WRKY transcription factor WRKY24-like [Euphorbia lathyris]|uniref:WRKY transcription factor WRKY24-like n=1 Tax=Euphorbia lathyris TaxID=212925 RepID=UPI003313F415